MRRVKYCKHCKKNGEGAIRKVWIGDEYLNVSCKVIEHTLKNSLPNGLEYNGHRICLFKCAKGYSCSIEEHDKVGNWGHYTHTKLFKSANEAICNSYLHLENQKARQLDLFQNQ